MKIGELFIALGFEIKGQKDFDDAEKGINRAAVGAGKLTLALDAVNVALLAAVGLAGRAGMALRNFAITTGLSTDELQLWQHYAVVNGKTADDLTGAIERLNEERAAFALGSPQNVGAWSLLGVNPTGDPFATLRALRTRLAGQNPLIAKALLDRVGLGGIAALIQAPTSQFEAWNRDFIASRAQIERLAKLDASWQSLLRSVVALRNVFATSLAPTLGAVARLFEWVAAKAAAVAQWLERGGGVASVVKFLLNGLVLVLLALGGALTVLTAGLAALALAFAAFSPAILAAGAALAPILFYATAIAAVLAGLVLIVDDIVTSLSGGRAVTRSLGEWLAGLTAVRVVIEGIWKAWDAIVKGIGLGTEGFRRLFSLLPGWAVGVSATPPAFDNLGARMARGETTRGLATANQNNNVKIEVHGNGSAEATGRAVSRSLREEIANAAFQMPVPQY